MRKLLRKPLTWVVLGTLAVLAVFGMWFFQPWKLWVDRTVDERIPEVAAVTGTPGATTPGATTPGATTPGPGTTTPAGERVLATGTFITHEHDTSGQVRIVQLADGRRVLVLQALDTSNGPDLRVWLTDQPVKEGTAGWRVFDDGKYLELGRLKGNKGNQVYDIPADADLTQYRSVSIWCKRFSVSFGAAELRASP